MKRVMLDTNIYEHILRHFSEGELQSLLGQNFIMLYGNEVVRMELREISTALKITVDKRLRSLRVILLSLYDSLNGKHVCAITNEMEAMAEKYYVAYRMAGGIKPKDKILNDFVIVACAASKNLDIVVSEDAKTMLSPEALSAYRLVNSLDSKRTPDFISFEDFKKALRGVNLD
ncbi:hypothetical protein HYU12_04555 [Candidatus Woesearchaeota archaeon]|nr:hypothetical protein [Candidatus Woesearchaeota archaeon]